MAGDEVETVRTVRAYGAEMAGLVERHRGRVVDFTGDNLLAEFPSAVDATRCAVEIQEALRAQNAARAPERRMEFRIGLHLGDVLVEEERIYGDGIHIAARLQGLAPSGGICLSEMIHRQVRNKLELGFDDLGEQSQPYKDPAQLEEIVHALRNAGLS
jgi:adenylate cyclase